MSSTPAASPLIDPISKGRVRLRCHLQPCVFTHCKREPATDRAGTTARKACRRDLYPRYRLPACTACTALSKRCRSSPTTPMIPVETCQSAPPVPPISSVQGDHVGLPNTLRPRAISAENDHGRLSRWQPGVSFPGVLGPPGRIGSALPLAAMIVPALVERTASPQMKAAIWCVPQTGREFHLFRLEEQLSEDPARHGAFDRGCLLPPAVFH